MGRKNIFSVGIEGTWTRGDKPSVFGNNPNITGHIDAMYNGSAAGHIYDKQPLNVGFF